MRALRTASFTSVSAAAILAVCASPALAGGFKVQEYSIRDMGLANAGFTTLAGDATTIYSNPAGMTELERAQINAGVSYILGRGDFDDAGSVDSTGAPLTGGDGGDAFQDTLVPVGYAAMPLWDGSVWVGLGISAPYGLSTDYRADWQGRYQAVESNLITVDINPSVAVQLTPWLSLGAGVSAQYADAELSNAIDFGTVCLDRFSLAACSAVGALPQQADGFLELDGNDWSWGYNVGALIHLTNFTRIGAQFRSHISHDLEGSADFTVPATLAPVLAPAFADTDAEAPLDLPPTASLGFYHEWTERLTFVADITWTFWEDDLSALVVDFENPAQPPIAERLNYDDTVRYSFGAELEWWTDLTVRAGVAFDESPTTTNFRSPRIPDSDRVIVALGLSWTPPWVEEGNVTIDAAYQHIFFEEAEVNTVGTSRSRLIGEFDNVADLAGLSLNWRF